VIFERFAPGILLMWTSGADPIFGQLFGFPMSNFVTTLCGMIVAASSQRIYGEVIW
jgi:NCS1 family nucleobase:cation symporter-1